MAKILLDYVFPIDVKEQLAAGDVGFLKKVAVVVKPKGGFGIQELVEVTSKAAIDTYTDNLTAGRLFDAGMNSIYLLMTNDLDIADILKAHRGEFYTVLVSDDFDILDFEGGQIVQPAANAALSQGDLIFTAVLAGVAGNDITIALSDNASAGSEVCHVVGNDIVVDIEGGVSTAQQVVDAIMLSQDAMDLITVDIVAGEESTPQADFISVNLDNGADAILSDAVLDLGSYEGVLGVVSPDKVFLKKMVNKEKTVSFYSATGNAENMLYAFGKLLSAKKWSNQQYIKMLVDEKVENLGDAENFFNDRISFSLTDDEAGTVLAFFSANKQAIIAPYIIKEISIKLQSEALSWINFNSPQYTIKEASLLESYQQEKVIDAYIDQGLIESGKVSIKLIEKNFIADGDIEIPMPTALWRVRSEMKVSN